MRGSSRVRVRQTQQVGSFPEGWSASGLHKGSGPTGALPSPHALSPSSSVPKARPHLVKSPELFDLYRKWRRSGRPPGQHCSRVYAVPPRERQVRSALPQALLKATAAVRDRKEVLAVGGDKQQAETRSGSRQMCVEEASRVEFGQHTGVQASPSRKDERRNL